MKAVDSDVLKHCELSSMPNAWGLCLTLCLLLISTFLWPKDSRSAALDRLHFTGSPEQGSSPTLLPLLDPSVTVSLRPTFFTPPLTSGRLKDVVPDSHGLRSRGLQASSTLLRGKLQVDSEVAFGDSADPTGRPVRDGGRHMMRLAVTGTQGAFRYGAMSRTAGKAYVEGQDQGLRELWGEYVAGVARFRSALGQTWNNVEGDPTQLRLMQRYGRLGVALARPRWPELSLSYTRASLLNAPAFGGAPASYTASHTIEAAVAYTKPTWHARLVSSYMLSDPQLPGMKDTTGVAESFTVSYRPSNTLTIIPSVGYRADVDPWSGMHLKTPSASASMNYRATPRLYVSALCGFSMTHSSDGTLDARSINSRALMAWTIPDYFPLPVSPPIVALEAAYTRTAHHSAALMDFQDVSGLVRVIVEQF